MTGSTSTPVYTKSFLTVLGLYAAVLLILLPYDSFRWGDGLEFAAVSSHLGFAHPSGYPLFILIGWIAQILPLGKPYFALLLICRFALLFLVAAAYRFIKIFLRGLELKSEHAEVLSLAGALVLGFSPLVLANAMAVEVYALNGMLIALLAGLVCGINLGKKETRNRRVVAMGVLLGLAASHHLTALSMAPAFALLLWAEWRTGQRKAVAAALAAAILIPAILYGSMILRSPQGNEYGIYWGAPMNVPNLIDHIRGGEYRQYQFMRQQPGARFSMVWYRQFFLERTVQILSETGGMIVGRGPSAWVVGLIFMMMALHGVVAGVRAPALALPMWGLTAAIVLQVLFVYTYNIPDIQDYYLGILLLLLPCAMFGLWRSGHYFFALLGFHYQKRVKSMTVLAIALAVFSAANLFSIDRRTPQIAKAWRDRLIEALPENAALITGGDADVYTMWYEQFALGGRRDVVVYGANFYRFPWFRLSLPPEDPRRLAVGFREEKPGSLRGFIETVGELAITPLLERGRVFTTINNPQELRALSREYQLIPRGQLLTDEEIEFLVETESILIGPPYLFEIERQD